MLQPQPIGELPETPLALRPGQAHRLPQLRQILARLERPRLEGEAAFRNEPFVRELVERFQATVRPETIAPRGSAIQSPKQEPT